MIASAQTSAAASPTLSIAGHVRETVKLALPVMLARAGLVIMITVDTVMTGRAGVEPLAHYAISLAPHITLMTIGIGLLSGTVVFSAQMVGAGRTEECGRIWHRALAIAGIIGLFYWVVLLFGEEIVTLMGQAPTIAEGGGRALSLFGPGMPAILLYMATTLFLEGINRPIPGMVISLTANLLNAALNWVLIWGHLGLPAMGAAGATLATSLTRWAMFLAILGYVLTMRDRARYGIGGSAVGPPAVGTVPLLKLGVPLALAIGLETSSFSCAAALAGLLGAASLAAYQISLNFLALVYMLTLGIGIATAVRVATAVGAHDREGAARAGWVGTGLVVLLMLLLAVATRLGHDTIARLYTIEPEVLPLAIAGLGIAAWMMVVDGVQGVLIGALRGLADAIVPTVVYGLSFWILGIPLAWWSGLRAGLGVPGLLWSMTLGLVVAALLLAWRFHALTRSASPPARPFSAGRPTLEGPTQ